MQVVPVHVSEFLTESQIKKEFPKEQINHSDLDFDEMLAQEIRLLDVNYIRAMNILGGK